MTNFRFISFRQPYIPSLVYLKGHSKTVILIRELVLLVYSDSTVTIR